MSGWRSVGRSGVVENEVGGGVELRGVVEEWGRSGWRNRGVEGRVKGVVEEE